MIFGTRSENTPRTILGGLLPAPKYPYRYASWRSGRHRRFLRQNEVSFPSSRRVNDSFNSIIAPRVDLGCRKEELRYWEKIIAEHNEDLEPQEVKKCQYGYGF